MCKIENLMDGKQLMKTGITLIVIGHLNFILGSIVHGTVLRHVTVPGDGILVEYSVTTIMSVISGIVSISTGIIVIVLSRDLSNTRLQYVVFASSMSNCLISLACMLGLAVSVIITIINGGRTLLAVCGLGSTKDILQVTNECPFDPTRIYVSYITGYKLKFSPNVLQESNVVQQLGTSSRLERLQTNVTHCGSCRLVPNVKITLRLELARQARERERTINPDIQFIQFMALCAHWQSACC
ncbi:transmembrane protein 54 isoform X1 [Callorhinchus milii]|uniref:transmembrane protein 54 isoform X1 n=1 Tax=Callorhinchus milii TaxID=7868 RepID=UPI001C3F7DD5|nr:transmembrane protein 54 isoform X1 [Callorhinchus milii]